MSPSDTTQTVRSDQAVTNPDPVAALAGAVADANDRLLGLLELTRQTPESLDEATMVTTFLNRAMSMLNLDAIELSGAVDLALGDVAGCRSSDAFTIGLRRQLEGTPDPTSAETPHVNLDFWRRSERFDTPDSKLLDGVANLTANAVRVGRMHRAELEMAVIAREHSAAAALASGVLPNADNPPEVDLVSCYARLDPARNTGGDFYWWQAVDGYFWFAIGDVSGKGLPAAVLMTTTISSLRASIERHSVDGPAAVLQAVEAVIHSNLSDSGRFVTLSIGRFWPASRRLEIVNAGHSPIVLKTHETCRRIEASKPPVGVLKELEAQTETVTLDGPASLVLATDGFTEQESPLGTPFGEDEFDSIVAALDHDLTAQKTGQALFRSLVAHTGSADQSDDRTLMVLGFS